MNCVNHPETPVSSYCQNCGKALCAECARPVGGFVYCEQCLAAKVGVPGAQPGAPFPGAVPLTAAGPNPGLAALLGFIPGVGAMYNGQFVKAMIHVLVFAVLVAMANEHSVFGIFVFAWIVYQVFDANQTAKARRDGMPLPDPFGLNELAARIGTQYPAAGQPFGGVPRDPAQATVPPTPGYAAPPNPPAASFVGGAYPPPPPAAASYGPPPPNIPYPPPSPYPPMPPYADHPAFPEAARRNEPAGAIVLIALGLIFLFGTLGVFSFHWVEHGWPLIIIAVGVWLFFKKARETMPPGGGQ
jgi:hypothetical protein